MTFEAGEYFGSFIPRLSTKSLDPGFKTVLFINTFPTCTQVCPPPYIGWQDVSALAEVPITKNNNEEANKEKIKFFIIKNDTVVLRYS